MTDTLEPAAGESFSAYVPDTSAPFCECRAAHRLVRGRGLIGLLLVAAVLALGIAAPLIAPFGPSVQIRDANLLSTSTTHLFGTDELGRDVFSRTLYGIRVDVLVIFIAVPLGAVLGSAAGVLASIVRPADVAVQRFFDLLLAFPPIILAIGLTAVTGTGLVPIIYVVVAVELPIFGRLLRSSILKVRELPYVEAAEAVGAGSWWTMRRHILPNAIEPLLVQLALSMSVAIFLEGAMSFIGIGVRPPKPSLGNLIAESVANMDANPAYAIGPLAVVAALVLGFQLIAQAAGSRQRDGNRA